MRRVNRPTRTAVFTLVILLLVAWFSTGCSTQGSPFSSLSSSTYYTLNELRAIEYARCHVAYHGTGSVRVSFVDSPREDGALAWGWNYHITIVRSALETWSPVDIEMVVGHEVAHAALGIWDEDEATRVASDAYHNAGCH
jgi:hypothetical protein